MIGTMSEPLLDRLVAHSLTLERLLAFHRVFTAGGYAAVAPDSPTRQSQLNRQVRQLEEALETRLFVRRARQVVPTPAAEALARALKDFAVSLGALVGTPEVTPVVLAAGGSVLDWLVAPRLPLPKAEGVPLVFETLSSDEVLAHLVAQTADVGIVRQGALAGRPLHGFRREEVARVDYAWFASRALVPDLARVSPIDHPAPRVAINGEPLLAPMFEALGPPTVTCETFAQAAAVIRAGRCVGLLPVLAEAVLPAPDFVQVQLPLAAPYGEPLMLLWRERIAASRPEVQKVVQALKGPLLGGDAREDAGPSAIRRTRR
jgi:DNA-binding transcriptional LysR family regulator